VSRPRPWRAVASLRFGTGSIVLGRTSAASRAGLDRFVELHTGQGAHVEVWEVLPHPDITAAAHVSAEAAQLR
jgi:hypothetical protein